MRSWTRAGLDTLCGGLCGRTIAKGQPLLVIALEQLSKHRQLHRCQRCAGEPVPDHLPPLIERVPIPATMPVRFQPGMLPVDWKQKQAGEGDE
jgi:hypothetical protein